MEAQVSEVGKAFLFLIGGVIFVIGGGITSYLLAPNRPNPEKRTTYECGEEPVGTAWGQMNFRFYGMGLVFLIFDVEILLLFPWTTIYLDAEMVRQVPNWGIFTLLEILIFFFILFLGYIYAYTKGALNWNISPSQPVKIDSPIPAALYEHLNEKLKKL